VEGVLMQTMQRRLGVLGEVYSREASGRLSWAARGLAAGGATLLATRGRGSRGVAALGGAMVCAGELCLRFAVLKAGRQSARDPKYTVQPQRARADRNGTNVTTLPA
jgi:hypothetical protein